MSREKPKYFLLFIISLALIILSISKVNAVNLYNNGLIPGYGAANTTGRYSCPGKTWGEYPGYAGVIRIADSGSESYYCADCSVAFPSTSESGSSTAYPYSSSSTCYYTCDSLSSASTATGSTYASYQHQIWDLFKSGLNGISCYPDNDELLSACSGSRVYILKEYGYSSYQKVVSVSSAVPDKYGSIKITKSCGTGVSGSYEFEVLKSNGTSVGSTSISCGKSNTLTNLDPGTYTVREKNIPQYISTTYKVNSSQATSGVSASVSVSANNTETVTFTNNTTVGSLTVNKICEQYSNGQYTITLKKNSSDIGSHTISCGTNYTFANLAPGTYEVVETGNLNHISSFVKIANGSYTAGTTISTSVTAGVNNEVTFKNKLLSGSITITKKDSSTDQVLSGVVFKLMLVNGTLLSDAKDIDGNVIGNKTTDSSGKITFANLPYGKYKIVEVSNPVSSYVVTSENYYVTIDDGTTASQQTITNNQIKLKIIKTDLNNTIFLENAKFKISNKKTNTVYKELTITSTENYVVFEPGEYTITETVAPVGYAKLFDSIDLTVKEDGSMVLNSSNDFVILTKNQGENTLTVKNDTRKVSISKQDINSRKEISGAGFKIVNKSTNVEVATWTSSANPYRIILPAGDYILTEITTPNGYDNNKIVLNFTVDENSKITTTDKSSKYININDSNITIYNSRVVSIPNTGSTFTLLIILGIGIIGTGVYLLIKNGKKNI